MTGHNFSQQYLDNEVGRQIELESYGYRFLRLNKFNLRPEQDGETKNDILKEKRAEYGKEIVVTVSRQLVSEFGEGFTDKNLRRMIQFAEAFPDMEIVVTLSRQLSWSHFVGILPIKDDLQRDFYAEMCRMERWSVRTLRKKIDGML